MRKRVRKGPTIAELRAKVDRAMRDGPRGRLDLGKMTPAELDNHLFGIDE